MRQTPLPVLAVATLFFAYCVAPAVARDLPPGGMAAQDISDWLKGNGYQVTVKADPTTPGDQIINAQINNANNPDDDTNFDIYMYDCSEGRCRSLQYCAEFPKPAGATLDMINTWNLKNRYIRAYIDAP
jgi:hypothetical protein